SAIGAAEDTSVGVGAPGMSHSSDEDNVRVLGVDHNARDLAHIFQSHESPSGACVWREINTASADHIVAAVGLASPHPDQTWIRWSQSNCADRGVGFFLKDRLP